VAKPSPQEAQEVFEARELVEPRTAHEAARRATAQDITRLRHHSAAEHAALMAKDHGKALRLSGLFHTEIARIAAQQTLQEFIERLVARSALIIALYWRRESARCDSPLRANKRETFDWLKFTLEGEGERTHGNAFTDTAFARYWV